VGPELRYIFLPPLEARKCFWRFVSKSCDECKGSFARGCEAKRWSHWTCSSLETIFQPMRINSVQDVKCFCNNKNVLCTQSMVWHFVRHPVHVCSVKEVLRDPTRTVSIYKRCKMFNKTDLIFKRLSSGDRIITEFNKVSEFSGGFCWQSKKIGETSCPTTKHATNGCAQNSVNYFDIYFYKSLCLHVQRRVKHL